MSDVNPGIRIADYIDANVKLVDQCMTLRAERDALLARVAKLEKLVAVLAGFDQPHGRRHPDEYPIFGMNDHKMTYGDARAARAAVNQGAGGD